MKLRSEITNPESSVRGLQISNLATDICVRKIFNYLRNLCVGNMKFKVTESKNLAKLSILYNPLYNYSDQKEC